MGILEIRQLISQNLNKNLVSKNSVYTIASTLPYTTIESAHL